MRLALPKTVLTVVAVIGFADFVTFGIAVSKYGGVPSTPLFHSIPAHGPYLLDSHGRYTEIDRRTYTYLSWQSRSLFLLWPLAGGSWWLRDPRRRVAPGS